MNEELQACLDGLRGWLSPYQIDNIERHIAGGDVDIEKFLKISPVYVQQNFDNGGFNLRDQYLLEFADH